MSCCRKLIHRYSNSNRGVFCLRWVLPLRIVAVGSLAIHLIYKAIHGPSAYGTLVTIIHIIVALLILGECRRSVRYHNAIKELELLGERKRALR
jgi:hypothetical protein